MRSLSLLIALLLVKSSLSLTLPNFASIAPFLQFRQWLAYFGGWRPVTTGGSTESTPDLKVKSAIISLRSKSEQRLFAASEEPAVSMPVVSYIIVSHSVAVSGSAVIVSDNSMVVGSAPLSYRLLSNDFGSLSLAVQSQRSMTNGGSFSRVGSSLKPDVSGIGSISTLTHSQAMSQKLSYSHLQNSIRPSLSYFPERSNSNSFRMLSLSFDFSLSMPLVSTNASSPTLMPTLQPTMLPTTAPTAAPTCSPTLAPTNTPAPTPIPTVPPTMAPAISLAPTMAPTQAPGKQEIVYKSRTTMTGITAAQFNDDAQQGFRMACASTLALPVDQIVIVSFDDARRRLLRLSNAVAETEELSPAESFPKLKLGTMEEEENLEKHQRSSTIDFVSKFVTPLTPTSVVSSSRQSADQPQQIDFVSKFVSPLVRTRSSVSTLLEAASFKPPEIEEVDRILGASQLAVQWQATVVVLDTVNPAAVANNLTNTVDAAMTVGGSFFTALATAMTNITGSSSGNIFANVTGIAVVSLGYTVYTYAPTSAPTLAPISGPPTVQTKPKKKPDVDVIVGSTVGSVVGFVLICYLLYYCIFVRTGKIIRPVQPLSISQANSDASQGVFSRSTAAVSNSVQRGFTRVGNFVSSVRPGRPAATQPDPFSPSETAFNVVPSAGAQPRYGQVAVL